MVKVYTRQNYFRRNQHNDDPFQFVAFLVIEDLQEKLRVALHVRDFVFDFAKPAGRDGRTRETKNPYST
jgi:hypothetical protein